MEKLSALSMVYFLERIGIIGAGSLGTQVLRTLQERGHRELVATKSRPEIWTPAGIVYVNGEQSHNSVAANMSDVIILGVKIPCIGEVAEEIADYVSGKLVISLAAAKSIEGLESILDTRVARVMTSWDLSTSVAAYSLGDGCNERDVDRVEYIFGTNSVQVEQSILAVSTFVACSLGLKAMEAFVELATLITEGMPEDLARNQMASVYRTIGDSLEAGCTMMDVYESVAGTGSFTEGLHLARGDREHYTTLAEEIHKTTNACK